MESVHPKDKILIVGQWFVSEDNGKIVFPGGTERYVYGLAKQLQFDGYDVMVLSATTNKDETGVSILDGLNLYRFKISEELYSYCDVLSFINTIKFVRRLNPDIVHVISSRYRFAIGAIMASKIFRKKTVFTLTLNPSNANGILLPQLLDHTVFSKVLGRSDIIISLSNEMKKDLMRNFSSKKIVIIPSFFMEGYYKRNSKERNSILFIGRLEIKQKGIDFLIKSLTYVKEKLPLFKLHIIGKGSSFDYLVKLVSDCGLENNVVFHGHVEENKLIEIYSTSEIFVLPSLREGMPMVLLEAMSAGLPIIAFDIDPVVEALDHGKYGVLVKTGDVKGLADAIIRLLKDDELRQYYSAMSLERSKRYSQAEVVREIEKIYSELI